jgi:hypothetical protein
MNRLGYGNFSKEVVKFAHLASRPMIDRAGLRHVGAEERR